jgi:hypothetical protein
MERRRYAAVVLKIHPGRLSMRRQSPTVANPFVMMIHPETVLQAVERSERLNTLQRRVCRPLDRPLIPKVGGKDVSEFDQEIDEGN